LLLLTLLGLAARLAFLGLEPVSSLAGDEHTWTTWGAVVLRRPEVAFSPLRFRLIFYPPLYPYFIGAVSALFGSLTAVKGAQAVVSSLLVPAVGLVGRRALGARAGLLAAGITALYPDLVWYSAHFWSETLFLSLLFWSFERLLAADASAEGATGVASVAGLLWGLAILTRETPLYFTPLAACWLAWRRPRAGRRRALAFALVALLTVVPWTYRNYLVYDAFVPVSTAGALNLWQGNARLTRQEVYERNDAVHGRIAKYRHAARMGMEAILERQPAWIFEKLASEMPLFWEADSLALVHIRRGAYGGVSPVAGAAAAVVVLAPYLALVPLFVWGVAAGPGDRPRGLLLAFAAYYTLLHVATHGFARYRLPIMPVLFLFAAAAVASWRSGPASAFGPRRWAVAGALAAVLGASVAPSLGASWSEPRFQAPEEPPADVGQDS
jgi:hypothetical protein